MSRILLLHTLLLGSAFTLPCTGYVLKMDTNDETLASNLISLRLSTVENSVEVLDNENKKMLMENKVLRQRIENLETECEPIFLEVENAKQETAEREGALIDNDDKSVKRKSNFKTPLPKEAEMTQTKPDENKESKPRSKQSEEYSQEDDIGDNTDTNNFKNNWNGHSKRLLLPTGSSIGDGSRVAFSAHLQNHLTGLGHAEIFKFDVVDINEGGAYDKATGIFSCPVSGTYFFTATVMSFNGDHVEGTIVINGVDKARMHASAVSGTYAQGSNSVFTHCNAGEHVWIEHHSGYGSRLYGNIYPHFGGFLLWSQ